LISILPRGIIHVKKQDYIYLVWVFLKPERDVLYIS
jgi:hypothetical protein